MNTDKSYILLVEDTESLAMTYKAYLTQAGYAVSHAKTLMDAQAYLAEADPIAILLDIVLPDGSGLDFLKAATADFPHIPIVMITGQGSINTAIQAIKDGASDFLVKPLNCKKLINTLYGTLGDKQAPKDRTPERPVQRAAKTNLQGQSFVGDSSAMRSVYRVIDAASASDATVFITGESGTGKEVCAEAVHTASPRSEHPFVAINCAAFPKDLIESEIFGHTKGAFTGASTDRKGAAEMADGGTLFLDELCEMDITLQSKLLRFIQTGTFRKVGGSKEIKVNVRFVCATNRDPMAEVRAGRFREDLYFRLFVIPIHLPPLRERGEDIMKLADYFLEKFAAEENKGFTGFSPQAQHRILAHPWRGNVRELQNTLRQAVVLHDGAWIEDHMLPLMTADAVVPMAAPSPTLAQPPYGLEAPATSHGFVEHSMPAPRGTGGDLKPMWMIEWDHIQKALCQFDNNVPKVAALLEMSPSTIYRRMRQFDHEA